MNSLFFSLNVGLYTFHHLKNIHFVPNLITNSNELCPHQINSWPILPLNVMMSLYKLCTWFTINISWQVVRPGCICYSYSSRCKWKSIHWKASWWWYNLARRYWTRDQNVLVPDPSGDGSTMGTSHCQTCIMGSREYVSHDVLSLCMRSLAMKHPFFQAQWHSLPQQGSGNEMFPSLIHPQRGPVPRRSLVQHQDVPS